MRDLSKIETNEVSGSLAEMSDLAEHGVYLGFAAFVFTVVAVATAPVSLPGMAIVSGASWILAGGAGLFSGAAFAVDAYMPSYGATSSSGGWTDNSYARQGADMDEDGYM